MSFPPVPQAISPVSVLGGIPKEGPSAVPVTCDFTTQSGYSIDLTNLFNRKFISQILTVFADNTANSSPLIVVVPDTNQRLVWPAYSQGYIPVLQASNMRFTAQSTGAFVIQLEFLNFPVAAGVWSGNGQPVINGSGAISVSDTILESAVVSGIMQTAITGNLTLTDVSGTITAGGTAQTALAAQAGRKALQFQNISAGDLWYRFTGAAAIAGTSSFKLASGAYWESAPGICPNGALSVIGATTGQQFSLVWA